MSERHSVWGTLPETGTILTTSEYLQTAESTRVQELIYGTLFVAESPTAAHQQIVLELAVSLREHVRQHALGTIWIAPLDVILDAARDLVVQPDLFFVSTDHSEIVTDRVWGAPDMVLEVLSPNPRIGKIQDRVQRFAEYGVRECWLIHQLSREIEILQLDRLKGVASRRRFGAYQRIESTVLPDLTQTPSALTGWS